MNELRQRMNDAMVLRGFLARTKESYLPCVTVLAKHYRCSPDTLDAAAIQTYLLYLITEKKLAYASVNQAACAIRFLFGDVLQQPANWLEIPMSKVPKHLPLILSRDEINRMFAHCRTLRDRTLIETVTAADASTSPSYVDKVRQLSGNMTTSDFSQKLSRLPVITKTLACRDAGMTICLPNPSKCGLEGRAGIEDEKMMY